MSLSDYTVPELKQIARNAGQAGYSNLPKKSLLDLIGGLFSRRPTNPPPPASPPRPASPPISGKTVRVPLTIPERKLSALPAPSAPVTLNADIIYELAQKMDHNGLRNLCSTNSEYRKLCQTPRFQRLIEQIRTEKLMNDKVQQVLQLVEKHDAEVNLTLVNDSNKRHTIRIWGPNPGGQKDHLSENIDGDNYFSSIVYKYLKEKLNFKGFENLTPEEFYDFLTQTKFDFGKFPDYAVNNFTNEPIYSPFHFIFDVLDESGKKPLTMYQLPQVKPDSTLISLQAVPQQVLTDMLTMVFKLYPNTLINGR